MGVKEKKRSSFPEWLDREMMLQLTSAQFSAGFPNLLHAWNGSSQQDFSSLRWQPVRAFEQLTRPAKAVGLV